MSRERRAQLELAKIYGATSPGTLDASIESSFASLSNFETKPSPLSYRAAALIEAINRMFLDVTESIEIVERMPIEQLVLPSEGFGAVCTNAAAESSGSLVAIPTHFGGWPRLAPGEVNVKLVTEVKNSDLQPTSARRA